MKSLLLISTLLFSATVFADGPSLKDFVRSKLYMLSAEIGSDWRIERDSIECVSEKMRGQRAGVCIVKTQLRRDRSTKALYAILVGEADENGGMAIRGVEFLKQNN